MRWGCLGGGTGQEDRRRARVGGCGRTCRHNGVHRTTAAGRSTIPGPLSAKTAPADEHLFISAHPEPDKHPPRRNPPPKPMTGEPQICSQQLPSVPCPRGRKGAGPAPGPCAPAPWAFGTAAPRSPSPPSLRIAALCPRGGLQLRAPRDAGGLEEAPGTCLPASASRTARPC